MKKKDTMIALKVDEDFLQQVENEAALRGITRSEYIRKACIAYAEQHDPKIPAPELNVSTVESVIQTLNKLKSELPEPVGAGAK